MVDSFEVRRLPHGPHDAITDVPGIEVGHYTHDRVLRGVTAVLCKAGGMAGVSVRGGNPGTYNTDAYGPTTIDNVCHAIGFSGGSVLGLAAIAGIGEWLYARGHGLRWGEVLLPVVAGAVIFDLFAVDPAVVPTAEWGQRAAAAAAPGPYARGNVGAGAGGTAGKGPGCLRFKGGLGSASLVLPGGIVVGALVVINALGGMAHPSDGRIYLTGGGYEDPLLYQMIDNPPQTDVAPMNTTLGIVATNARLDKAQLVKVADLAHNGFARAIRPMHTMLDGDTIFAIRPDAETVTVPGMTAANMTDLVGAAGADAIALACLDAAAQSQSIPDWPSLADAIAGIDPGNQPS
jgi:L-aminopeptidase/D-esterase-like protein